MIDNIYRQEEARPLVTYLIELAHTVNIPLPPDDCRPREEREILTVYGYVFYIQYVDRLPKKTVLNKLPAHQKGLYKIACRWLEVDDMPAVVAEMLALLKPAPDWITSKRRGEILFKYIKEAADPWYRCGFWNKPIVKGNKYAKPAGLLETWLSVIEIMLTEGVTAKEATELVNLGLSPSSVMTRWNTAEQWLKANNPYFFTMAKSQLYEIDRHKDYYQPRDIAIAELEGPGDGEGWLYEYKVTEYEKQVEKILQPLNKKVMERVVYQYNKGLATRNPTMAELLSARDLTIEDAYNLEAFDTPEQAVQWRLFCERTPLPDDIIEECTIDREAALNGRL